MGMRLHAHGMPCAAHKALAMVDRGGLGHGSSQAQVEGEHFVMLMVYILQNGSDHEFCEVTVPESVQNCMRSSS